jgi:pimeloyl-ACP methyl ester carboxylesterase
MPTLLLIHGGLWEDMDADGFWRRPGIVAGFERLGFTVVAPDRLRRPTSWTADAEHVRAVAFLGEALEDGPVTVVAGSFGCSVAARLALDSPGLAARLVLAWPASAGDQFTAIRMRAALARLGAPARVLDALISTGTLPGVTDAELGTISIPVGVIPAAPPGPPHPRAAVDALLRLLPSAVELPGFPEAPRPEFPPHREAFLAAVAGFAGSAGAAG